MLVYITYVIISASVKFRLTDSSTFTSSGSAGFSGSTISTILTISCFGGSGVSTYDLTIGDSSILLGSGIFKAPQPPAPALEKAAAQSLDTIPLA